MDNSEIFFIDYINKDNSIDDLKKFYSFINEDESDLEKLIEENKEKYYSINLDKFNCLSDEYNDIVNEMKRIYNFISPETIKLYDYNIAFENKKILNLLLNYIRQLKNMVEDETKDLLLDNKLRQEKLKHINYKSIDKKILTKILEINNNIVSYNFEKEYDVLKNYKKQKQIKKELKKIYRLINIEIYDEENINNSFEGLKLKLSQELKKIYDKTTYLEDLMLEGSKHIKKFLSYKSFLSKLTAYDDTNYLEVSKVYNYIKNNNVIIEKFRELEELLINEREYTKKEQKFIYNKIGLKNIKISLDYISANYENVLNYSAKKILSELYEDIKCDNITPDELYQKLKRIVNYIWNVSTTDVYSYEEGNDFCFICTNNQFIDEKYQSILITKKMLNRVENYSDYQIGFICNFNNNILYTTEYDDIMLADYNDMSSLKTPKQIEQEFLNFKIRNRIALNGYITSISAVYFIEDGDFIKYRKALELANQYKLPLLILKKDN